MVAKWLKVEKGEVEAISVFEEPPLPEEDPVIAPYWPKKQEKTEMQIEVFSNDDFYPSGLSFYIKGLCGYSYTPEKYKEQVKILESFGFECMRSRRGNDGKYWEVWYLCSLICARGKLKEEVERLEHKRDREIKEERRIFKQYN